MASLMDRLSRLARSPKAQQIVDKAKEQAAKPENREKVESLTRRLRKR